MNYQVLIPNLVQKQLDNLPENVLKRVIKQLDNLHANPHPPGCLKLKGHLAKNFGLVIIEFVSMTRINWW
jgi:mRNA-degrading endonuclease RelE of RelBE toxin-antitoxin system